MKLSIVIPVYNVADYLERCVDSLLCQIYPENEGDFEIILVDDGSTDGLSGPLCDEYRDAHPALISVIHKRNGGLGDARNVGADAATGDYIFFLDSDDTVTDDMFARLLPVCETGADIIIFGYEAIRDGVTVGVQTDDLPTDREFCLADTPKLLFATPNAVNKLWKREFLEKTGIRYPSKVWYEDVRTVTKLYAEAESVRFVPEAFYRYIERSGSIMRSGDLSRNLEILDAFDDILSYFQSKLLSGQYKTELEGLVAFHVLLTASVRVARIDCRSSVLSDLYSYAMEKYPNCGKNPYIKGLSLPKRLAFYLVCRRAYTALSLLFKIKKG